jgi:hypothetical protein
MVKLKARGLWDAIESGGDDVQEDLMALEALSSAVPQEMVATVASKKSAKEAWDAIKTLLIGDDCVRASTVQQLLQKSDVAMFQGGESIEDFSMCLSGMAQHLATLGEPLDEPKVVMKFLCSVPRKYKQVVVSKCTQLDVSTLTLANVTRRLMEAEQEMEEILPMVNHNSKLYLTEEAWVENWKLRNNKKQSSSGSGRRHGSWHGGQ